jgi:DNA (cytosine-5)-methyltransferase 1
MEFGATYPYETETPYAIGAARLRRYAGAFGLPLRRVEETEIFSKLPSHARTRQRRFPDWKILFIRSNREFYRANRRWIDPWLPKIQRFPSSRQKLEWNCRGDERDIWRYVIQMRASGVRVKRPTTSPSLIAMTTTQVPIVGWERRYVTPAECARLQSMGSLGRLPKPDSRAFAALGNAINVKVVEMIGEALLGRSDPMIHAANLSGHNSAEARLADLGGELQELSLI